MFILLHKCLCLITQAVEGNQLTNKLTTSLLPVALELCDYCNPHAHAHRALRIGTMHRV